MSLCCSSLFVSQFIRTYFIHIASSQEKLTLHQLCYSTLMNSDQVQVLRLFFYSLCFSLALNCVYFISLSLCQYYLSLHFYEIPSVLLIKGNFSLYLFHRHRMDIFYHALCCLSLSIFPKARSFLLWSFFSLWLKEFSLHSLKVPLPVVSAFLFTVFLFLSQSIHLSFFFQVSLSLSFYSLSLFLPPL